MLIARKRTVKPYKLSIGLGLLCLLKPLADGQIGCHSAANSQDTTSCISYLIVEKVASGSEGERAGLRPDDILLHWTTDRVGGDLESPFDFQLLQVEQRPRGVVRIEGRRGNHSKTWLLKSAAWGVRTRPSFSVSLLSAYREVEGLARAGNLFAAIGQWRSLLNDSHESVPLWLTPWVLVHAAALAPSPKWEEFDKVYREAIDESQSAAPGVRAQLFDWWADSFQRRDDLANAEKYYNAELTEKLKESARNVSISVTLSDLGVVAIKRGNFVQAETFLRQALAIQQELAPASLLVSSSLGNLGVVAHDQGDLAKAEYYYLQAIAAEERFPTQGNSVFVDLANLGELARRRGDLAAAVHYVRKALILAEQLHLPDDQTATVLYFLGNVARDQGDLKQAERYQRRALALRQKKTPGSLAVALSLVGLGDIAQSNRDLVKADEYYQQALAIEESIGTPTIEFSGFLNALGEVATKRRDWVKAEEYYRRSLAFAEKMSPGGWESFESQAALAKILHRRGQYELSANMYQQALATLEGQTARLGGSDEVRAGFRGRFDDFYRAYVGFLAEQGKMDLAFEVLEASRARTLLEMLARSRVNLRQGGDPELLARENELQESIHGKSEYRVRLLAKGQTEQQLSVLDREINQLLRDYRQVEAEIRDKSPAYATLTAPQAFKVSEIQQLLDPDTILLEYSLGEDGSYVWLLSNSSLAAYQLPKRDEIERLTHRVYNCFTASTIGAKAVMTNTPAQRFRRERECARAPSRLSQTILAPVDPMLKQKRLLIVSDGALQYIPFSALPVPGVLTKPKRLIENHEIVNLPSASILAELRRQRVGRQIPTREIAVLADPVFDSGDLRVTPSRTLPPSSPHPEPEGQAVRAARDLHLVRRGNQSLSRLLYSRNEAKAIMAIFPPSKGMMALDFQASRPMAMNAALAKYSIVHFATHGLLNNKHPELSGLVFSLVDKQGKPTNGFLTLQDVYNLELPVDLVVLSGCQTGLGEQVNGEGLIGLTRGFMYAGATRVVASLWSVSDMATAQLMAKFYKAMERDSMRPSAALRKAQIDMLKQKRWTSPYFWAAFQIQGEWR
jgi:CHAT domain-containing protein/Tfp pilus assembly protein PilF